MNKLSHIQAYILGLFVGGGKISGDTFIIDLPYNKWGMEPSRMKIIAVDILTKIKDRFKVAYDIDVITYDILNKKWVIKPSGPSDLSALLSDLEKFQLPTAGFLLKSADLTNVKANLKGINIDNFLSGIFDARASLTVSHRRFVDKAPVVSIEIPGSTKNFKFIVQLCSWLTELGSVTDQILYNHPNQHAKQDPYYRGWKKGFKIRFLVKSFLERYSFALQAKGIDANIIQERQETYQQLPCALRKLTKVKTVTVHRDQNSDDLPIDVRNKIFFHYHHFCAVIGCPFAPTNEIDKIVRLYRQYITIFPRLSKGSADSLMKEFASVRDRYFATAAITEYRQTVAHLLSNKSINGFSGLKEGIAFLFAPELAGKRHKGALNKIVANHLNSELLIYSFQDNFDSPLLFVNRVNDRAFICSAPNNTINQTWISSHIAIEDLVVKIQ